MTKMTLSFFLLYLNQSLVNLLPSLIKHELCFPVEQHRRAVYLASRVLKNPVCMPVKASHSNDPDVSLGKYSMCDLIDSKDVLWRGSRTDPL